MNIRKIIGRDTCGFTLIEVIVIVVVVAIMGTLLFSLMGTNLQSALPVGMVNDQYKLVQEMEKITSLYRETTVKDLATFQSTVVASMSYVDSSATGLLGVGTVTGTGGVMGGTYANTRQILRITLRLGDQSVRGYFTE